MEKRVSKFLSLFIITILVFTTFSFSGLKGVKAEAQSNDEDNEESVQTIEGYENYLKSYDVQTAIESGVDKDFAEDAVKDAQQQLEEFMALSDKEKKELIKILSNPNDLEDLVNGNSDNPDIEVTEDVDDINLITPFAAKKNYTVSYTRSISIKKLAVIKYKVFVKYSVQGTKVKSIVDSDGYVVRNLSPMTKTSLGHKKAWITTTNKGAIKARFTYKVGPFKGMSIQLGNIYLEAHGTNKGKRNYARSWKD